jgi:hypothetical protein
LYTWRWAFYINLLFGAVLLPIYLVVIPSNVIAPGVSRHRKLLTMDWVGAALSVVALTTLVMGISFGGTLYAWNSGQLIALLALSGVLWVSFLLQQGFTLATSVDRRVFPIHLLGKKEPALLFTACASAGIVTYPSVYYIPIYFQYTISDNAIRSAVRLLSFICLLVVAIQASGAMMSRVGYYKPWYVAGSIMAFVPGILLCMFCAQPCVECPGYYLLHTVLTRKRYYCNDAHAP